MRRMDGAQKGTERFEGCGKGRAPISRAGTARALLLLAIAIVALLATLALYGDRSGPGPGEPSASAVEKVQPEPGAPAAEPTGLAETAVEGPRIVGGIQTGPAGEYSRMPRAYDGTGTILGEIVVDQGVAYPETWTVHLEPSRASRGSETAVPRTIEAEPGQRTFELLDVPMGSYRIRASADGLESTAQELALFRIEGMETGIQTLHATLKLVPMASVEGAILRADGTVADGLDVYLVERGRPDGSRLDATTDTVGRFRVLGVSPGAWLVNIGDPVRPLIASIPVEVGLEPVQMDEIVLPALCTLQLRVTDEYGRPFPDVDLVGYLRGAGKGSFRRRTDAYGETTIPYLLKGSWRVEAEYAPEGQSGLVDLSLTPGDEPAKHDIVIR